MCTPDINLEKLRYHVRNSTITQPMFALCIHEFTQKSPTGCFPGKLDTKHVAARKENRRLPTYANPLLTTATASPNISSKKLSRVPALFTFFLSVDLSSKTFELVLFRSGYVDVKRMHCLLVLGEFSFTLASALYI